jgi:hypothetical protein
MKRIYKEGLTLLALSLAEGAPLSPVQLQKAVFLLQERLPQDVLREAERFEFVPHNYGPYCADVYRVARSLAERRLVEVREGHAYTEYLASPQGIERGNEEASKLPPDLEKLARDIVTWVRAQTFRSLVSSIYQEFPEYKVRSIFNG